MKLKHIFTAGMLVVAQAASAQVADTPNVFATLQALGPNLSRDMVGGTQKLYGELRGEVDMEGLTVAQDQAYGGHIRQVLDVFAPNGAQDLPVLVFAHGGGFVRGDKKAVRHIAHWAAAHDMIGIAFNYRFAPEVTWPSGAQDVAGVLRWIQNNIAELGGDPGKVIIAGNSAGAMHIADYSFREDLQLAQDGVIGAILISPPTSDLNRRDIDPKRDVLYYGIEGDRSEQSVVNAVAGRRIPMLVAYAENEPDVILDQTRRMIDALADRDGRLPLISGAAGHNHISIVEHIGTADETLGPDMLEFIKLQVLKTQ